MGDGPELVIGLIGAVGCGLDRVVEEVDVQLSRFGYKVDEPIKVSDEFRELEGFPSPPPWGEPLPPRDRTPADVRYGRYMDAGDRLRRSMGRKDAAMFLALRRLRSRRGFHTGDPNIPASQVAYVIDSLKTPEEVRLLRKVYEGHFIAISAHAPRGVRCDHIAEEIAKTRHAHNVKRYRDLAEFIVYRDERGAEDDPFGQNVADTFPLADVFVETTTESCLGEELNRFFSLVFGHPFLTPTRDEQAMAYAHSAALRSAALSRQVGAVLTTRDGEVIATGTNEVPRAGGGVYWHGATDDGRDFTKGYDTSERMRTNLLGNTIEMLLRAGWQSPGLESSLEILDVDNDADKRAKEERIHEETFRQVEALQATSADPEYRSLRRRLLIQDVIEFYRELHAEVAALADAGLRGVPTEGAILYCTTHPCHNCARQIVASGIERVVFLEPYPKSLVTEFYGDSIAVDAEHAPADKVQFDVFVGVAPRRHAKLFRMLDRRRGDRVVEFRESEARLRSDFTGIPVEPGGLDPLDARIDARTQEFHAVAYLARESVVALSLDEQVGAVEHEPDRALARPARKKPRTKE